MEPFEKLLNKWNAEDGTEKLDKPDNIESYFKMTRTQMDALNGRDLDHSILVVTQYLVYISNKLGTAEAYRNYLEDQYDDKLQELATKVDGTKFKTLKERSASALEGSPELKELREKLGLAKIRYSKIKYMTDAARELSHCFKKIMERRLKCNEFK